MVRKNDFLNTVLSQETARTTQIVYEIDLLSSILKTAIQETDQTDLQEKALDAIQHDIHMIHSLNQYIQSNFPKSESTYSLRTNKNLETFTCAQERIEEDFDLLINDDYSQKYPLDSTQKPLFFGSENNSMGTSMPNCIQTAMLTILRAEKAVNDFYHIRELADCGIYNASTSPCIHSTKLPENFDHHVIPGFSEWGYFFRDGESPPQGELLFLTLGYAFGGSRQDVRYIEKEMAAEDCSSGLAKWMKAEKPFSTYHLKLLYEEKCEEDNYCLAAQKVLSPIKEGALGRNVESGDIFLYKTLSGGAHTGIISEIKNETCFENLSYNRNIPDIEGLGYRVNCIDETGKDYLFFSYLGLDDISEENYNSEMELHNPVCSLFDNGEHCLMNEAPLF